MSYWLFKSEPDEFGIDDLKASPGRRTSWDGVRNYQARNFMRDDMRLGERGFLYHSNCAEPGIAGIVEIVRTSHPDVTALDPDDKHYDPKATPEEPRWYMVDLRYRRKLKRVITLAELKTHADGALSGFALLRRGNRLSVLPLSEAHWNFILSLE